MIELLVGAILGGGISWFVTHIYYRKSSTVVPEWAKPIIERLPEEPPTKERLLELFQDALDKGEIVPHPEFGYVACPECNAPSTDFEEEFWEAEGRSALYVKCPHCGWSYHSEI